MVFRRGTESRRREKRKLPQMEIVIQQEKYLGPKMREKKRGASVCTQKKDDFNRTYLDKSKPLSAIQHLSIST